MIDTHAHLTSLDDADEAIKRAAVAGVTRILTVGTSVEDCRRALALAEAHDGVFAILGIHPHDAGTATEDDLAALRELLAHPKAVELRLAASEVPAERILAETDSPYLAPQPVRGRPNEPSNVVHTVAALAQARREEPEELAAQIERNAAACFGL